MGILTRERDSGSIDDVRPSTPPVPSQCRTSSSAEELVLYYNTIVLNRPHDRAVDGRGPLAVLSLDVPGAAFSDLDSAEEEEERRQMGVDYS